MMFNADYVYKETIDLILKYGKDIATRNGTTKRLTNIVKTFDGTPLVTIRKTAWRLALREMEWFLSGSSNINDLHGSVRHWWTPWADDKGEIPNNYGKQFRSFGRHNFDQINGLLRGIKHHPFSRRNVITLWETGDMAQEETPITNCHGTMVQIFGYESYGETIIDMTMYQRSGDFALGVQHNWIQYYALLLWLARETDTKPGKLTWMGGDIHLYQEHLDVAKKITEIGVPWLQDAPRMMIDSKKGSFMADEFIVVDPVPNPVVTDKLVMVV
jgi:thymidylate synthase